jgi:glutaminyl-tRNA synthetase
MVRLKSAYIIKCEEVIKDSAGTVVELRCTYVPESKSGSDVSGIAVKGVIHWVSVPHAVEAEVRLYDRLFTTEDLNASEADFRTLLNPDSLKVLPKVYAEPSLAHATSKDRFQFMRIGYFCLDPDSVTGKLVFNRTVTLRDMWSKEAKKG